MSTEFDAEIDALAKAGKSGKPSGVVENELAGLKLSRASLVDSIAARKAKIEGVTGAERAGHLRTMQGETLRIAEIDARIVKLEKQSKPDPKPTNP